MYFSYFFRSHAFEKKIQFYPSSYYKPLFTPLTFNVRTKTLTPSNTKLSTFKFFCAIVPTKSPKPIMRIAYLVRATLWSLLRHRGTTRATSLSLITPQVIVIFCSFCSSTFQTLTDTDNQILW